MSNPLINKGFSPLSQLSVFLGVWGVCFFLASLVTVAISLFGGLSLTDMGGLMRPENRSLMIATQVATTFFLFGVPAVAYAFICYKNGWNALGFGLEWKWVLALLAIVLLMVSGPLTEILGTLNKAIPLSAKWRTYFDNMEKTYEDQVKAMLHIQSLPGLLLSVTLIAALPALFEELFFRGGLQGFLTRWVKKPWVAILLTSIIFSAIHLSWYGFFPRVMLGVVLGVVYYATGNLWYCILMHFVNNAVAVVYFYTMHQQGKEIDLSQSQVFPSWAWLISLVLVFSVIWYLFKISKPHPVKEILQNRNPFANREPEQAD